MSVPRVLSLKHDVFGTVHYTETNDAVVVVDRCGVAMIPNEHMGAVIEMLTAIRDERVQRTVDDMAYRLRTRDT